MKLYIAAYTNQKGGDVFNMSFQLITQEVWGHSPEEVIGLLHKAKEPPQDFNRVIMTEITPAMAQKVLDKAKE